MIKNSGCRLMEMQNKLQDQAVVVFIMEVVK